jgi:hypothetical protein
VAIDWQGGGGCWWVVAGLGVSGLYAMPWRLCVYVCEKHVCVGGT